MAGCGKGAEVSLQESQRGHLRALSRIFEEIKVAKWAKELDPKEKIRINCWSDFLDEEIPQYYGIATNKYSLMFRRWAELANIKIENATLDNNLREEIVAHFLWEITYSGYHESKIQRTAAKLNKACDEIKSGKAKTVPFDSSAFKTNEKAKTTNSKVGRAGVRRKKS